MAQFTRVNQMMGADLNTSLREFFTVIETSGDTLLEELKTALGPTVEQPGPLQSPMSHGDSQLVPLHVRNQSIGLLGLCKVRGL